jgi:hypothetical protein
LVRIPQRPILHWKPGFPLSPETTPSKTASQEREHGDNQEDDKEDFRHTYEGTGNSAETKEGSDQGDN